MDAETKAKWVAALRSGKYRQGRGVLRSFDDKFCCLGVLCDLVAPELWKRSAGIQGYDIGTSGKLCPTEIAEMVGLDPKVSHILAMKKNDAGVPFTDIADWIEQNL